MSSAPEDHDIAVRLAGSIGRFALNVDFVASGQGITGLFGASGSGKTSILRAILGISPLPGSIRCGGEIWQDASRCVPAAQRGVGMVFQSGALFPHLDVRGNLDYAIKRAPPGRIGFSQIVEMLDLGALLARRTQHLSGGERQRVAIGRALLAQPKLLLLDEPVSALDQPSRDDILSAIDRLGRELGLPMIYVSHDLAEMARIAGHLVLMSQGSVIAQGPTADVLADLALPLAQRAGALSVLDAHITGYDPIGQIIHLQIDDQDWQIPGAWRPARAACRLRVMASDVGISRSAPAHTTILNMPVARIAAAAPLPETGQINVLVRLGPDGLGQKLLARITRKSWDQLHLQPGECVRLLIKGVGLAETG